MKYLLSSQDGNRHKFEHENPFLDEDEEDEVAPVGYRYRKWSLGNDINLVARTEHDAVQSAPNSEIQFINIKVRGVDTLFLCLEVSGMAKTEEK